MPSFEEAIENACNDGTMPGAVLFGASKDGTFNYAKAFGKRSLTSPDPMKLTDIFLFASATKLLTSIAAVQCIERGLIDVDQDLADIFPELGAFPILTGFDEEGKAVMKKRERKITLSHLLTHSSGTAYDFLDPLLARYCAGNLRSLTPGGTVLSKYGNPLIFEPGTSWNYSTGIDFAGKVVSILTKQPLEQYMRENIFEPLGLHDITFFPRERDDYPVRKAGLSNRAVPTGPVEAADGPILDGDEEMGGAGGYGSLADYMEILKSLLKNDGKLLGSKGRELLITGRLEPGPIKKINEMHADPNGFFQFVVGDWTAKHEVNYALGGIVVGEGEGWRGKGTLVWGGMANLFWSIDTTNDLALLWGTQVYPAGDDRVEAIITLAEKSMYEMAKAAREGKMTAERVKANGEVGKANGLGKSNGEVVKSNGSVGKANGEGKTNGELKI